MDNKRRSLLHEMNDYIPHKDKETVVESRAHHIITSAINLLENIHMNFSEEEAEILEKRLISSIKGRDYSRFDRQMKKIKESKE